MEFFLEGMGIETQRDGNRSNKRLKKAYGSGSSLLALALLGEHFGERFDRSVGKANAGAAAVRIGPFDQPGLGGPAVGGPGLVVEHGGKVVQWRDFPGRGVLFLEHRGDAWALPCLRSDVVRLECFEPELGPRPLIGR